MTNPCDNTIDPMGGATIPSGFEAVSSVVDGQIIWTTNPPAPADQVTFIAQQNGGRILIDEGIALAISRE